MKTSVIEKLLKASIGLNISSIGKSTLESAIKRRMHSLNLVDEDTYSNHLKSSKSEVNELIEEVTVNETWFFRDKDPFTAMANFAQTVRGKKPHAKLEVLSLPCSSGEEPYSIAITLVEAGYNEFSFHIDAVDINSKVLDFAKEAIYKKHSFRGSDNYYCEKYFRKSGKYFILKNKFKHTVTFRKGNLLDFSSVGPIKHYDIIFCRNLLIYLDRNVQANVINTLDNLLVPGGLLFIGHAEAGVFADSKFVASPYPKSFSFVRKSDFPSLRKKSFSMAGPNENGAEAILKKRSPDEKDLNQRQPFVVDEIIEARYLIDKKEYDQALYLCEKHIEKHGPTSNAYFWLGTIFLEKEEKEGAIKMLRKSIYLDPENIDAMELLSTVFLQLDDTAKNKSTHKRIQRVRKRLSRKGRP